jgi:nicotinamide riboside transporter PnuC
VVTTLEWFGAATGIIGALLLAANIKISAWAFVIYVISSLALMGYAWLVGAHGILMMQTVFFVINLLGIYRWLVQPTKAHADFPVR